MRGCSSSCSGIFSPRCARSGAKPPLSDCGRRLQMRIPVLSTPRGAMIPPAIDCAVPSRVPRAHVRCECRRQAAGVSDFSLPPRSLEPWPHRFLKLRLCGHRSEPPWTCRFALMNNVRRIYDGQQLVPAGLAVRPRRGYFCLIDPRRAQHQTRRIVFRRTESVLARQRRVWPPSPRLRSAQADGRCLQRQRLGQPRCSLLYRRPERRQGSDVARLLDAPPDRNAACRHQRHIPPSTIPCRTGPAAGRLRS